MPDLRPVSFWAALVAGLLYVVGVLLFLVAGLWTAALLSALPQAGASGGGEAVGLGIAFLYWWWPALVLFLLGVLCLGIANWLRKRFRREVPPPEMAG